MEMITAGIIGVVVLLLGSGLRTIRPTHRGLVETFGKYTGFRSPGLTWIVPLGIQRLIQVNTTEQMSNIEPQEIITKDNLNAQVDLVVYYKIRRTEDDIKASIYEVNNVDMQLETLARTTARNVIGTLEFKEVNSERDKLNIRIQTILAREAKGWGVDVLKVELKDIQPPADVQSAMNMVIKAENEKIAAVNLATARETEADGSRRAAIKKAEGDRQASILVAEGQAKAFELINKSFTGNAKDLKKLEVVEATMKNNSKIVIPEGKSLVNVIGSLADMNDKK